MNKIAIVIASAALGVSIFALIRKEDEIKALNEAFEMLRTLNDNLEFAKIVDHLEGED